MKLQFIPLTVGPLDVNCYLVHHTNSNETIIIDPGGDAQLIIHQLKELNTTPTAILLTHAHFDHIGATPQLFDKYKLPIFLHQNDNKLYNSPNNCMQPFLPPVPNLPATTNTLPKLTNIKLQLIPTPGHSQGSVSYYFPEQQTILTGDTLFNHGIGRYDLPGGNQQQLYTSIKQQLTTLPANTIVKPGHGSDTTIAKEIINLKNQGVI